MMQKSMTTKDWNGVGDNYLQDVKAEAENKPDPNPLLQLVAVTCRTFLKRARGFFPTTVVDIVLLLISSIVIGGVHGTGWTTQRAANNAVMAMTTLATLSGVTFIRTFSRVCVPHADVPNNRYISKPKRFSVLFQQGMQNIIVNRLDAIVCKRKVIEMQPSDEA